jgi:hypothetical protein
MSTVLGLALVLAFVPQAQASPAPVAPLHTPEPGPRVALAGLAGFQSVSRLDFGGGAANRLTAAYVFPDRARWHFEPYAAATEMPGFFLYRQGERVLQVSGGPSEPLDDAARDVALLQMELRRAVMLWPDGFAWSAEADGTADGTQSAPVFADSCCRARPLGRLHATLADGRVRRVEARDLAGQAVEALEIRAWQELAGRAWPRTLALAGEGGGFVETIESISTRVHFLELSFVPPDRRKPLAVAGGAGASAGTGVLAQDLVPTTFAKRALAPGLSLDGALEQAQRWLAAPVAEGAPPLDPTPTIELDEEGRPTAVLLRLKDALEPPPPGFESTPERPGLVLGLARLDELAAGLARAQRAVPAGSAPGSAYVRVHARTELAVELVLPLGPRDGLSSP